MGSVQPDCSHQSNQIQDAPTCKENSNDSHESKISRQVYSRIAIKRALAKRFLLGSKAYEIIRKTEHLPSKSTLSAWTSNFNFTVGIDSKVIYQLKKEVQHWSPLKRDILLAFDETALQPHLDYDVNLKKNM